MIVPHLDSNRRPQYMMFWILIVDTFIQTPEFPHFTINYLSCQSGVAIIWRCFRDGCNSNLHNVVKCHTADVRLKKVSPYIIHSADYIFMTSKKSKNWHNEAIIISLQEIKKRTQNDNTSRITVHSFMALLPVMRVIVIPTDFLMHRPLSLIS